MEGFDFVSKLEKIIYFYWGVGLIVYASFIVFLSQSGMCLREIALNTRKENSNIGSEYKIFEWICYIFLIVGLCSFLVGLVLIFKGL